MKRNIIDSNIDHACNVIQEFVVKFSPWDAIDFAAVLEAQITSLDSSLSAPRIILSGAGLRPKAHFEFTNSDYLTAGRRALDMRNPDGTLGALVS